MDSEEIKNVTEENNSIEMKIAKIAAENLGQEEPINLEEAKIITGGYEISAAKGIAKVLNLDSNMEEKLINDLYTKDTLSEEIAHRIKFGYFWNFMSSEGAVEMLSVIHDEWVKNNSNKFLQEGRNKEYQFSPLMLLDWKEVKRDLLFLKPILETAGIELDEKEIELQFDVMQKEFLIDNEIYSSYSLKDKLSKGAKFYPALEGIETQNGGKIEELLKNPDIVEKMSSQIEERVPIKTSEEMALDIIKSDNGKLNDMRIMKNKEQINDDEKEQESTPLSVREILLSKSINKPYHKKRINSSEITHHIPAKVLGTVYDEESKRIKRINEYANVGVFTPLELKKEKIMEKGKKGKFKSEAIGFGPKDINVTDAELIYAGLDPEKMGWEESRELNAKDIAEADKEKGLTTSDVGKVEKIIQKIKDKVKGKEQI